MIKRLFIYTAAALLLGACADEDFRLPNGVGEDGTLNVKLSVPELQSERTRANEWDITSMKVLVFDSNDVLKQISPNIADDLEELGNHEYNLKLNIDAEIRSESNLKFYFLANYPTEVEIEKEQSLSDFKNFSSTTLVCNTPTSADQHLRMSGMSDLTSLVKGDNSVQLKRNSAKITVTDVDPEDGGAINYYSFQAYGTAEHALTLAGCFDNLLGDAVEPTFGIPFEPIQSSQDNSVYVHPTKNDIDSRIRPFVIIGAPYEGNNYYYRVDFRRKNSDGRVEDLNLVANHWYKFIVTSVTGKGCETLGEAAVAPSSLIMVDIKDVTPVSYNMVTDGSRELGVNHELVYDGAPGGTADLFLKLYSPNADDYPAATVESFNNILEFSDTWLSVKSVAEASENEAGAIRNDEKVYKVSVEFSTTSSPGTLEGEVSVYWKGLTRVVPVTWKREFNGNDLCDVKLTITGYNADGTAINPIVISDYWSFLKNDVAGVSAEANGGVTREEGLHFPVMYGESGKLWQYQYVVTYKAFAGIGEYDYRISSRGSIVNTMFKVGDGSAAAQVNGTTSGNLVVTVTKPTNSWLYTYGEMVLEVSEKGKNKWSEYPIDLYHTGFFHDHNLELNGENSSSAKYRADSQPAGSKHWYYYEVLGDDEGNYWLDRNLGAESAGFCSLNSSGDVYTGKKEALGGYYRVALYTKGGNPQMYAGVCPPGFQIPRTEIWNTVRNSSKFVKTETDTYLTAANGKRIYFPKARYYDVNNQPCGESRSGYYWSSTPSVGFEKDEIGNWLESLLISGSISSYLATRVEGKDGSNGWALSVRCVNSTSDSGNMNRIYFSVEGATHVFLYNTNGGKRTAATTWPGKAIGDFSTVKEDRSISFVYDSPTTPAEDWYVIFNYKDKDGKIHTFSNDGNGGTITSTNMNVDALKGWKVKGDVKVPATSGSDPVVTNVGGYWKVAGFKTDNASVSFATGNVLGEMVRYKYRIFWPYSDDWNGLVIQKGSYSFGDRKYSSFPEEQTATNAKYWRYSDSFAVMEFEVSVKLSADKWTVEKMTGNQQYGGTQLSFTFPTEKDSDGYYTYTMDDTFTGTPGKAGMPDYFFVYCYDLEGWGDINMTTNVNSTVTKKKLHDYWPALYQFKMSENNNITQFTFTGNNKSITAQRNGLDIYGALDGSYFNNGNSSGGRGDIIPSKVSQPANSQRRIAVRQISNWGNIYIYDWGGSNSASSANSKKMTQLSTNNKNYYYYDISSNASGFLFTDGSFTTNDSKQHQTTDIKDVGSKWVEGKLVDDWYANPGFSVY